MSATDTKETPKTDFVIDAIQSEGGHYQVQFEDLGKHARQLERDLTAVTAQRDRALGLLGGLMLHIECLCQDRCPECGQSEGVHHIHCSLYSILIECEALRKGER